MVLSARGALPWLSARGATWLSEGGYGGCPRGATVAVRGGPLPWAVRAGCYRGCPLGRVGALASSAAMNASSNPARRRASRSNRGARARAGPAAA